eukprot:15454519-Alexandrium_andersonii.AAC.1
MLRCNGRQGMPYPPSSPNMITCIGGPALCNELREGRGQSGKGVSEESAAFEALRRDEQVMPDRAASRWYKEVGYAVPCWGKA